MQRAVLLGVPFDPVSGSEAIDRLRSFLSAPGQHHVMTPNSEMLVEASRNPAFLSVLQSSALNLPDSQGVVWMVRLTGQKLPERVTGVDTVMRLCADLPADHPVFLLGAAPGIAEKAAEELRRKNPSLKIAGTFSGSPSDGDASEIIQRINAASPCLLFVAFGAPAQDLWIAKYLKDLPSVRVAMGVGGTFDFLAGEKKRAPRIMQKVGLEWLWRLILEPRRRKRIWNAVIVFPLMALRYGSNIP